MLSLRLRASSARALPTISGTEPMGPLAMELSDIRVVYLMGLPHCGSTILDLTLQQAPGVTSVGEANTLNLYFDGGPRTTDSLDDSCTCGAPVSECPFWLAVDQHLKALGTELRQLDLSADNQRSFARDNEAFFLGVARASNANIVVDSSKCSVRLARLLEETRIPVVVVHLTRSLKGYLASNKKRYN